MCILSSKTCSGILTNSLNTAGPLIPRLEQLSFLVRSTSRKYSLLDRCSYVLEKLKTFFVLIKSPDLFKALSLLSFSYSLFEIFVHGASFFFF